MSSSTNGGAAGATPVPVVIKMGATNSPSVPLKPGAAQPVKIGTGEVFGHLTSDGSIHFRLRWLFVSSRMLDTFSHIYKCVSIRQRCKPA